MILLNCIPCPSPVRHFAHHVHRHALRPIGRRVHHAWHHAPRIVAYGCCAAAVGGLGLSTIAPPGGYFPQTPASYAPNAAGYAPIPYGGYGGGSQGWPEMPNYSGSGMGGIGGGGATFIPVYSPARPEMLSVQPGSLRENGREVAPISTQIPEPSALLLLLAPLVALPVLRRTQG